ncbi:hypothetical protein HK098_005704 [Nowakowskiella sp. JEL0407]|nr:hypothetical protein HK098_005704 [Nowakowskiella sp. JEL0407]
MSRKLSLYQILNISQSASKQEIKHAFYKLSMQYHPDKNKDDESAHAKFLEINSAYSTLSNDVKRREYDRSLSYNSETLSRRGTGPQQTMRKYRDQIHPDDWILYRQAPPRSRARPSGTGWAGGMSGDGIIRDADGKPIFNFNEHQRQHFGDNYEEKVQQMSEELRAKARLARKMREEYYNNVQAGNRYQARLYGNIAIIGTGLIAFLYISGWVHMIFV